MIAFAGVNALPSRARPLAALTFLTT